MADYIPFSDSALLTWARGFADHVAAAPAEYGLEEDEASAIGQAVDSYAAAFTVAASIPTRTRANVAAKNAARGAMLKLLRRYARAINASPNVSESCKIALGLTRPAGRTRITAPASRPVVNIVGVQPLRHVLRFTDAGGRADTEDMISGSRSW